MTLSTYAANAINDHVNGRASFTMPAVYVALYTASPGVGGTAITNEASYVGYARKACGTGGGSIFGASASGSASLLATLTFPQISSGGPITVTYVGLVDSASGAGNLLEFGQLTAPRTYNNSDTPNFSAGNLIDAFA